MRGRTGWILAIGSVGLLVAGCGTQTANYSQPSFPKGNPVNGEKLYATTCASCHGPAATGVPGVAPSLRNRKAFGKLYQEANLAEFIQRSMPRTNPGILTKQQAADLASFIWGLNGHLGSGTQNQLLSLLGTTPTTPAPSTAPSAAPSSAPPSAPKTGTAPSASEIAAGQKLYGQVCITCHGNQGQGGVKMNAPALWGSSSTITKGSPFATQTALAQFIKTSMPPVPTNGFSMGSLTQAQANDVAAFLLHQNHLP